MFTVIKGGNTGEAAKSSATVEVIDCTPFFIERILDKMEAFLIESIRQEEAAAWDAVKDEQIEFGTFTGTNEQLYDLLKANSVRINPSVSVL
jgi:hypothetical protein